MNNREKMSAADGESRSRVSPLLRQILLYLLIFSFSLFLIICVDLLIGAIFLVAMLAEPIILTVIASYFGTREVPMNFTHTVSYICELAAAVLFMLYLDGLAGAFFVIALIAAPLISLLLALDMRGSVSCAVEADMCSLDKGDNAKITVTVRKKGFLPSPFVTVKLYCSGNFVTDCATKYRFVFGFGHHTRQIVLDCRAVLWGRGTVTVADVYADDFMGLFSFSLRDTGCTPCKISVLPSLTGCNIRGDFIRRLAEAAAFDDSEETIPDANVFNGTPGYEHTKYTPGDSLKRINWKLSAKRDELLVRKPEGSSGAPQTLILDSFHSSDRYEEQTVLETVLSVAKHFAESALPCRLYLSFGETWECVEFQGLGDIESLRFRMTDLAFSADSALRVPDFSAEQISRATVFSASPDTLLAARLDELASKGASVSLVSVSEPPPCTAEKWRIISENGEFDFVGE